MPWDEQDKPDKPKYDFSEKFKDKSTRELLDSIPREQKALLKGWFGTREDKSEWPEAPAYWLTADQLVQLNHAMENENLDDLIGVIRGRAKEIDRDSPEIATTLYGNS